jgi:hypothetical protein
MADVFFSNTYVTKCPPTIDSAFCALDFTNCAERVANVDVGDTGGEDQLTVREFLSVISQRRALLVRI